MALLTILVAEAPMIARWVREPSECEVEITRRFWISATWCGSLLLFVLVLLSTPVAVLLGQGTPVPLPGANRLAGVVTDTLGNPLAEVFVVITKLRRQTRSRDDGSFQFDSVPAGTYDLTARSMGLIAGVSRVVVGHEGGSVVISMIRLGTVLQAKVTVAERGGLSGIIGDTAYRALPDVQVMVIGHGLNAETDSSGAFFLPLRPGEYMLQLKRDGFTRQLVSVTVPKDEGRRIAAWMVPESGHSNSLEASQIFDLHERMMRVSPASSKYFTRESLQNQNVPDLQALARRWGTGRITLDCSVSINGSSVTVPLGALTTDELEFVEMYLPSKIGAVRTATSISGRPTKFTLPAAYAQPGAKRDCGNLTLIAWLRK